MIKNRLSKAYIMVVKGNVRLLLMLLTVLFSNVLMAQTDDETLDAKLYEQQVKNMVRFLEFSLNSIGANEMSVKQKETIINESYGKFFKDAEVQIEDDLVEGRDISIYKSVQAYLKDIDFFFKEVNFKFRIREINHFADKNGQLFYKVHTDRYLKGITIESDSIENVIERFIEINFNTESKDLKIASIYTTPLNQDVYLMDWWSNLSPEWKTFFGKQVEISDSVLLSEIREIVNFKELTITESDSLYDLSPLSQIVDLQKIAIHNKRIISLMPLRNLTKLESLDCSGTSITNLTPLKYSINLTSLNCSETKLSDIEAIENLNRLKLLNFSSTFITDEDLEHLKQLTDLEYLNLSKTGIYKINTLDSLFSLKYLDASFSRVFDLKPLAQLNSLQRLNLTNSEIVLLNPLSELKKLEFLKIDSTRIRSLQPLQSIESLRKINCDKSFVTEQEAKRFMSAKNNCIVIYESQQLSVWWKNLSDDWKTVFNKYVATDSVPTKEQLHEIANIQNLDISGVKISDIKPIKKLAKLHVLKANKTLVEDISTLIEILDLKELDISGTKVTSLMPLIASANLEKLRIDSTEIEDLSPLGNLKNLQKISLVNTKVAKLIPLLKINSLEYIYCDHCKIPTVRDFILQKPDCQVIYDTESLVEWWVYLSDEWKKVLWDGYSGYKPTREELHQIASQRRLKFTAKEIDDLSPLSKMWFLTNLEFEGTSITTIEPLKELTNLTKLRFRNTLVSDLSPVEYLKSLQVLECSKSPIQNIEPLQKLEYLMNLNIENTQVETLEPIRSHSRIMRLNCAGTKIKSLKPLSLFISLQHLNCSNTNVRLLQPLFFLNTLTELECYNTKILKFSLKKFKEQNSACKVVYY